jgi:hypothetical protein
VGAMLLAFVPPPDEAHSGIAVLKIAGMTVILLLVGTAVYVVGSVRVRQLASPPRPPIRRQ